MKTTYKNPKTLFLALTLLATACSAQPTNPTPTVDIIGTTAAQLASVMLTQTAGAVTSTPLVPTETPTPEVINTPTLEPTIGPTPYPKVTGDTPCYKGPGSQYPLVLNIGEFEEVIIAGVANVPGWYVIYDPIYGALCWISSDYVNLPDGLDVNALPTIMP